MYRREPGEAVQRRPVLRRVRLAALGVHAAELVDPLLQALLRVRVRVRVRVRARVRVRVRVTVKVSVRVRVTCGLTGSRRSLDT